jgi:hypothetical protein
MKLIYAQGFSKTEKLEWKPVVFNNIVQSFRLIFEAMNELDISFENPENEASSPPSHFETQPPHVKSFLDGAQAVHPVARRGEEAIADNGLFIEESRTYSRRPGNQFK